MNEDSNKVDNNGVARLKQHADLVQRLVKQVPTALATPGVTIEQVSRLHKIIQKGVVDFSDVQERLNEQGLEGTYQRAASSLAKIWSHLSAAAEARMADLAKNSSAEKPEE